jgi:hypothetical protein
MEPESILHDHYDVRHRARAMTVKGEVITHLLMYFILLYEFFRLRANIFYFIVVLQRLKWLHLRSHRVSGNKMPYDERYRPYVEKTRLLPFVQLVSRSMPHMIPCAITALVDRWRPETHSFHLPCGEMTVTLQDVSMILALPIRGQPVCVSSDSTDWREHMAHMIGTAPTKEGVSAGAFYP